MLLAIGALATFAGVSPARAQSRSCDGPRYRDFDFWLGRWDVFERGGSKKVADVRITATLDGCVLREDYEDRTGLSGLSLSSYDADDGQWQQTWHTNRGQLLVIHGHRLGPGMSFTGWMHEGAPETHVRATWAPDAQGIRETAERSVDGGVTWTAWFDLSFRRKPVVARDRPAAHDQRHDRTLTRRRDPRVVDQDAIPPEVQGTMAAHTTATDLDELLRRNDAYIEAVKASSTRQFELILAVDFVCTLPDGTLLDRAAFLQRSAAPSSIGNLVVHDVNVRLFGDLAIVHAATTFTRVDGTSGTGRYTDVWARRDGRWLAVAAQFARN